MAGIFLTLLIAPYCCPYFPSCPCYIANETTSPLSDFACLLGGILLKLNRFVSKTLAAHLKTYRPLEGWEQLNLIYHSPRSLKKKRRAYETLLREFSGDKELIKHLRRNIRKIDRWLAVTDEPPAPERVFIAESDIHVRYSRGIGKQFHHVQEGYFSTFRKARRWLAAERIEVPGDAGRFSDGNSFTVCQKITEVILDSNREKMWWAFDRCGNVVSVHDDDLYGDRSLPEECFIDLGGVFTPGDIVVLESGYRSETGKFANDSYYGVVASVHLPKHYDPVKYENMISHADYGDMCELIICYDKEMHNIWHEHWPTPEVDLFDGELPEKDRFLRDVSRHLKGETRLADEETKQIDPFGFFGLAQR